MDKPSEPGWYEATDAMSHRTCVWWTGSRLLPFREFYSGSLDVNQFTLFVPLIPKPAPEIIIGDGVTVLRPGVWVYQEAESEHSENEEGALIVRKPEVANEEWKFTRIGDVPGEA